MANYVIYTDSACDIPPAKLRETGIGYSSLTTYFEEDNYSYTCDEISPKQFYEKLREGKFAKTSAVNIEGFTLGFEKYLKEGLDILYVGLSSGVSSTYNSAYMAAQALSAEYPERKIVTVDSCSGSAGQAILLHLMQEQKEKGATIEEAAAYAEQVKEELCLWATFDDLTALKRSGRVSFPVAIIGNFLNIKPIIYVDKKGKIANYTKVRGRKKSIETLLEKYEKTAKDKTGKVYLAHGDCKEEIEVLAKELRQRFGAQVEEIMDVGPVIGVHAGIGSLVISYLGKKE